jgi:outer membrane protein TolC
MKILSKGKLIITLLLLFSILSKAQEPIDSMFIRAMESGRLLPMLIDSAIKNNPEVNRADNSIGLAKENLQIAKKSIYSAFSLFSSYNYGNNANVITGSVSTINQVQSSYYNVGVYVQLPMTHLVSRKNTIRASEFQVKMAENEKKSAEQYLTDEVIREYQELKLALQLVKVSSEGKQTALVNYQMCQKQFLQNDVALTELSRIQDIYTKASIEFEIDVNRFQTAYLKLENFTGVKLANLIATLK